MGLKIFRPTPQRLIGLQPGALPKVLPETSHALLPMESLALGFRIARPGRIHNHSKRTRRTDWLQTKLFSCTLKTIPLHVRIGYSREVAHARKAVREELNSTQLSFLRIGLFLLAGVSKKILKNGWLWRTKSTRAGQGCMQAWPTAGVGRGSGRTRRRRPAWEGGEGRGLSQ